MVGSRHCGILGFCLGIFKQTISFSCAVQSWKKVSPYWYCCAWGQEDWVERTGKGTQLQWAKTGREKDLELVTNCGLFSCNWNPRSDIERIERLGEEVKCRIELLQKAALLGTEKFVRQVLETRDC